MKIIEEIGEAAMLEQLAEECTELAKAALKMARIIRKENPTPVLRKKPLTISRRNTRMLCSVPENFHLRLMRNKWHENMRDGRRE